MGFFKNIFSRKPRPQNLFFEGADYFKKVWAWITAPSSPDWEIRNEFLRLRAAARELARNNSIIKQFLALLASNVIGPDGISLQSQIRNNSGDLNKAFNQRVEDGWSDFCKAPTVTRMQSMTEFSQLLIKSVATDGEAFVRMVFGFPNKYGFALQPIDADLVDYTMNRARGNGQNEIRMGIEIDEYGAALAIWIWDSYPADLNQSRRERIRIDAKEIIHLYVPDRVGQSRGITWFNSVMIPLQMLKGYFEAELFAARLEASAMPIFKSSDPGSYDEKAGAVKFAANPGEGFILPPGLEMQNWTPTHPGGNFPLFVKSSLRLIACGLKVSYNALANDLENVNYSSIRSGLLIERDNWRVLQRWWIDRFLEPVYEGWISAALLKGAIVLDSRDFRKFLSVRWVPRGWAWVDPLKDANAAVIAVMNGFDSRGRLVGERGEDVEEIFEELAEEKKLADEYGLDFSGAPMNLNTVKKETQQEEMDPKSPDAVKNRFGYLLKDESEWTEEEREFELGRARNLLDSHLATV